MSTVDHARCAPPRLLIVGAGAVVTEYYIAALRELGWLRHALIVDAAFEAVRRVKATAPEAAVSQMDFQHALADADAGFDAAIIALPNRLHPEATRLALERGLDVLCEKPLALTSEACHQVNHIATHTRRVLAVGMVRRLLPSFGMLRKALQQGLIGELIEIDVEDGEPYAWSSASGAAFQPANGGVLADMGVHYLDLIEEIGGGAQPVSYSDDHRGGVEANLEYTLRTLSGVPVRLRLSRTRPLRNTFVCRGTRGELIVDKDRFDGCWWRSNQTGHATWLQPETPRTPTLEACFAEQLVEFARAIRDGASPAVSAERAASTVGLIEWAYNQRAGKRAVGGTIEQSVVHPALEQSVVHPARDQSEVDSPREQSVMNLPLEQSVVHPADEESLVHSQREMTLPAGRVCVTGATGFIGTHLVERLGNSPDYDVVAPVRSYRTCAQVARFPIDMPRLDLLDFDQVRRVVSGARFVFHLAYGRDGPQQERVTIEGTRNVVDAAIEAGSEAVVVLSSIYVYGQPAAEVDEAWPYHPVGGVYGTSKALMERWCLHRAQGSSQTRVVVLSPSCVYGPGGDAYSTLPVRLAREGGLCWINDGRGAANYTYVENLIDGMLLAATSPEAHGRRFIINDGTTTWRSFLGLLLGDTADALPSYTTRELRELHRRRHRPNLVDVARIAMADQSVRTALRETRVGEAMLWGAEHATPGVMARMRRGWHVTRPRVPRQSQPQENGASPQSALPPVWLSELYGPAPTVFRSDVARGVLGWMPRVSLDVGVQATRAWVDENL